MPRAASRLIVALLLGLTLSVAAAAELTVSAAASLTNAFRELGQIFEASHPGTRVHLNFAASGTLLMQIARGAPVDVFASADQETMDQAQEQSLVRAAERRDFVSNRLVLIVPASAQRAPAALEDLLQPQYVRIAIGLPASVPAGRYAKGALEHAKLWAALEPKIIGTQNVRQSLDYVARGEVDAGFVFSTDAALMPEKVRIALMVPTGVPVRYPVAPVAGSPNAGLARSFVDFLVGDAAQEVLARYGFGKP